jgi:hypothetical protein
LIDQVKGTKAMTAIRRKHWRRAAEGVEVALRDALRQRRFVERMDAASAAFVGAVLLTILAVAGGGAYAYLARRDKPMVYPIADARKLVNVRDGLSRGDGGGERFLDAAYASGARELYISRTGGLLHRFQPDTGLWSEERPQKLLKETQHTDLSDFTMLRAGCGADAFAAAGACADPDILWGRTDRGGLAYRRGGEWRTLFDETRWLGADGEPVDLAGLTAAGVSGDGALAVLFSRDHGKDVHTMGVYDVIRRSWLDVSPDLRKSLPAEPNRVRHAGDSFWIGGRHGLGWLGTSDDERFSGSGKAKLTAGMTSLRGEVLDIQALGQTGEALALMKSACPGGAKDGAKEGAKESSECLRLARIKGRHAEPEFLIDETNVFTALSAGDLHFADVHGGKLIAAGRKGVYCYDPDLRRWERLDAGEVTAVLTVTPGREFVYGRSNGVDGVVNGARRGSGDKPFWSMPGRTAAGLQRSPRGELIALTEGQGSGGQGSGGHGLASLPPGGGAAIVLHDGAPSGASPRKMLRAAGHGDYVVMTGEREAVFHDLVHRRYASFDTNQIDQAFFESGARLVATEKQVFAMATTGGRTSLAAYDWRQLAQTGSQAPEPTGSGVVSLEGPLRSVRAWSPTSISAMDANGRPHVLSFWAASSSSSPSFAAYQRFAPNALSVAPPPLPASTSAPESASLIGNPARDGNNRLLDASEVRDVIAAPDSGLFVATAGGYRVYDPQRRTLAAPEGQDVDGGDFQDIALINGHLVARSGLNRLALFPARQAVNPGQATTATQAAWPRESKRLVGGERAASLKDSDLSDALAANDTLYIAGKGQVFGYDMNARSFASEWRLGDDGKVALAGVVPAGVASGQPVSLAGGKAWAGDKALAPDAGPVRSVSLGPKDIWTVRQGADSPYLMAHPLTDPWNSAVCYFRNPSSGAADVIDAKALGGRISPPAAAIAPALAVRAEGETLVLTEDGLNLYDERHRTWRTGPRFRDYKAELGEGFKAAPGDRLYIMRDKIVLHVRRGDREFLTFTPLSSIPGVNSCGTDPLAFQLNFMPVVQASVNVEVEEIVWRDQDGAVRVWRGEDFSVRLADQNAAPDVKSLFRLFPDGAKTHFASADGVWTYDSGNHGWSRAALRTQDGAVVEGVRDLSIDGTEARKTVTVWTDKGATLVGEWAGEDAVTLNPVGATRIGFDHEGRDILDVADAGEGRWLFVLPDRLKTLDARKRTWLADVAFPNADAGRQLKVIDGVYIVTEDQGRVWWIARSANFKPPSGGQAAAADLFWRYDRSSSKEQIFVGRRVLGETATGAGRDADGAEIRLLRLAIDGSAGECSVPAGQKEPECEALFDPAPLMEADDLKNAYAAGQRAYVIFDGKARPGKALGEMILRVYERDQRKERVYDNLVTAHPKAARESSGVLWALLEDGAVLRVPAVGEPGIYRLGASELFLDAESVVWITRGKEALRWSGSGFTPLSEAFTLEPGEELTAATVAEGGVAVAATTRGRLLISDGRSRELFSGIRLPAQFAPREVKAVFPVADGRGVWLQKGGALWRLEPRDCPAPGVGKSSESQNKSSEDQKKTCGGDGKRRLEETRILSLGGSPGDQDRLVTGVAERADQGVRVRLSEASETLVYAAPQKAGDVEQPRLEREAVSTAAPPAHGAARDIRNELALLILPRNDGNSAFDPLLEIVETGRETGVARGGAPMAGLRSPSGHGRLATPIAGGVRPADARALDAGWLAWRRDVSRFRVRTPGGGALDLLPEQLVHKQEFIFAAEGRAVGVQSKDGEGAGVALLNPHGLWTFSTRSLGLDDRQITFVPAKLAGEVRAAHGRFYGDSKAIDLTGREASLCVRPFQLGDVTLQEDLVGRSLSGQLAGQAKDLLSGKGFPWDRRRSIAWSSGKLYALTDLGVHNAFLPSEVLPGPEVSSVSGGAVADAAARLFGNGSAGLFLKQGGKWLRRDGARWVDGDDPFAAYSMVEARPGQTRLTWRREGASVALSGREGRFIAEPSAFGGLRFSRDELLGAAYGPKGLVVATRANVEHMTDAEQFLSGQSRLFPAVAVERLETMAVQPWRDAVYAVIGGRRHRFNEANGGFIPVEQKDDPGIERVVFARDPLRIVWRQGQVEKFIKARRLNLSGGALLGSKREPLDGEAAWEKFSLIDGVFPFDVVLGVEGMETRLFVLTPMGVQIYPVPSSVANSPTASLFSMEAMVRLRDGDAANSGFGARNERIGVPYGQPGAVAAGNAAAARSVVAARSGGACLLFEGDSVRGCQPQILDKITKGGSAFYEFWRDEAGRPRGAYRLAGGGLEPGAERLTGGRFDHDHIADFLSCQGKAVTAWSRGWLTVHGDRSLSLRTAGGAHVVEGSRFERLHCLENDVQLRKAGGEVQLKAGPYALDQAGKVWRFDGAAWKETADPDAAAALTGFVRGDVIHQRGRLRLKREGGKEGAKGPFSFEAARPDGQWTLVEWRPDNRTALDDIRGVTFVDGKAWALTAAGFVRFDIGPSNIALDLERLTLINQPALPPSAQSSGAKPSRTPAPPQVCLDADIETTNGETLMRCGGRSDQIFAGRLDVRTEGDAFTPRAASPDPFAERELVKPQQPEDIKRDHWSIWRKGAVGANPGHLEIAFKGEPVSLEAGRFSFDAIHSVSGLFPGSIELASRDGGWWRIPAASASLDGMTRPALALPGGEDAVPRRVAQMRLSVFKDSEAGAEPGLCVLIEEHRAILVSAGFEVEQVDKCDEYLGGDALWRYMRDVRDIVIRGGPRVSAPAPVVRELIDGRFSDDAALAAPVSMVRDGGLRYLIPTRAGVLVTEPAADGGMTARSLLAPPNVDARPPLAVYVRSDGLATYFDGNSLRSLNDPTSGRELAAPGRIYAVEDGPKGFLRLKWASKDARGKDARGWTLTPMNTKMNTKDNAREGEGPLCQAANWNVHDPRLAPTDGYWFRRSGSGAEISVFPVDEGVLAVDEHGRFAVHDLGRRPDVIAYAVHGDRLFLLEPSEALEVNLDFSMLAVDAFAPHMKDWRFPRGQVVGGQPKFGRLTLAAGTRLHQSPDASAPSEQLAEAVEATAVGPWCGRNWLRVWTAKGGQRFMPLN